MSFISIGSERRQGAWTRWLARDDCDKSRLTRGVTKMANTYTQVYIQVVFAVNGRQSLISPSFKEDLFKYVGGTMPSILLLL